jgi:hypothetical protein
VVREAGLLRRPLVAVPLDPELPLELVLAEDGVADRPLEVVHLEVVARIGDQPNLLALQGVGCAERVDAAYHQAAVEDGPVLWRDGIVPRAVDLGDAGRVD